MGQIEHIIWRFWNRQNTFLGDPRIDKTRLRRSWDRQNSFLGDPGINRTRSQEILGQIEHGLRRSSDSTHSQKILEVHEDRTYSSRSLSQIEHKLLGQCKVMYDVDQLKHITRKTKQNKSVLADNPTTFTYGSQSWSAGPEPFEPFIFVAGQKLSGSKIQYNMNHL